ncbi:MAG: acyl-CoA dehydrogenase family protein [Deltaproteobacteria bacterium]|jgi:alkylation response protein AidB-like acyl-CoA dehydrogenase|nr:acyl-CoA dehydrogenase family protein [Deltaproteobacteria bacterium]
MDFELTNRQKQIRLAVREFAEGEIAPVAQECEIKEDFPRDLIKKAAQLGFIGVFIKKENGGLGLGFLEHATILEEFWRVDPGLGQVFSSLTFGAEELQFFSSEEQKKKYLPPLVKGDWIMGFSITEPEAGSDTASAVTTAKKEGEEYVINGNKVMITNGTVANFVLVYCLTHPEETSRSKRHSILLVETDRPGYKADRIHRKMGIRASDTANIYFNNVRVPKENLIGVEGNGFSQLMKFFDHSRSYVAAHGVGLAQGAMEQAINYVKKRKQFGKTIASFQVTQFKIAEMATLIETARSLVHKTCWNLDRGNVDSQLAAMAKWWACNVAVRVVDEALQLHGGYGYLEDYPIERFYRAAKILELYEGTKEIDKMMIGRKILGVT